MKCCFYCLFFVMMLSFSCTNNHQNATVTASNTKKTLDTADAHLAISLSLFCTKQVMAAELVKKKASTRNIRDFGKQMSDLYTQLGNRLNLVSEDYLIQLPYPLTVISKENFQKLKEMKSSVFDHAYLLQMLKDHNAMIREINAAKNIQCLPLKTFVVSNQSAIIKQAYALSALKNATP